MKLTKASALFVVIFFCILFGVTQAQAGAPSGTNWFQLLASPYTGGDNTGDGGSGNPNNFNYYYVGQTLTESIQISSDNTNASNIWIDYNGDVVSSTNLLTGTYFPSWSGQTLSSVSGTIYRIKSTGYRTSGFSTGVGNFGSVQFTAYKPTAANYGTSSYGTHEINVGTIGLTTESNISYGGADLLQSVENFNFHIWADTKKPYALNPSPANGGTSLAIENNYTFDLRDSKNGEGDDTGVGTGVDTATPPGTLTFNDGGGAVSYTAYDSYLCSGVWGTNLCSATINPPSPSGIPGDTRNWKYSTTYTFQVGGFRDLASASQNQLGDANGPNTMDTKTWTFTTEADTTAPRVVAETPVRGSGGNSVSTNLTIDVADKKSYPSTISGTGVDIATCRVNISSPSFPLAIYQQGSGGVSITAIDYGYRITIDPAVDFAQNETVSVSVYDCQDLAAVPNVMTTDNYTFTTADTDAPYVDSQSPANDATIAANSNVVFHIKDTGTGVDLGNTVIYVNGTYYSNAGGAGVVTTNGTRITFGSSLNFNGGNYAGDTTGRTGTASDYTFTINPQTDFATGEAVPIIVYTRDLTGNLMERVIYAAAVSGAGCPGGSTYCGSNTSWDGALLKCVGTGGGSGGGGTCSGGGATTPILSIDPQNVKVVQIDESSVLVSWFSSMTGNGRVIYGTDSPSTVGPEPNYGYTYSTAVFNHNSVYHAVVINGLKTGTLYYFRPVTEASGNEIRGSEVEMAPLFKSTTAEQTCEKTVCPTCPVPPKCAVTGGTTGQGGEVIPVQPTPPVEPGQEIVYKLLKIYDVKIMTVVNQALQSIIISGTSQPNSALTATIE